MTTLATLLITLLALAGGADDKTVGLLVAAPGTPEAKAFTDRARAAAKAAGLSLEVAELTDELPPKAAVTALRERGAWAIVGPQFGDPAPAAAVARSAKVPLLALAPPVDDVADALCGLTVERLRVRRMALVMDPRDRESKALQKALEVRLEHPYELVETLDLGLDAKGLAKKLEKSPAQLLIVDGAVDDVRAALEGALGARPEAVVLTPRCMSPDLRTVTRELYGLLPRSPETLPEGLALAKDWKVMHGWLPYGVAEADDALALVVAALADAATPADVALDGRERVGARAAVRVSDGRLSAPLGLWKLRLGSPVPYLPSPLRAEDVEKGTASIRDPDPELGVPFAAWRTDRFALEDDTQWVVLTVGEGEEKGTLDADLLALGLSTGGSAPLVDHLVKEELLARLLAFTSMKFLRNEDGTSRQGESLGISFATQLPPKAKKGKAWTAQVGGDDDAAGGRAWPGQGYCEIYSTFIRRTIFQDHALDPPVSADDLKYLDGSYRFGGDVASDKRSELIRALINGYAGSMALTAAHEIGHVAGLSHVTGDEAAIMNVEEGSGVDHRDGRFIEESMEILVKRLGVVGKKRR